MEGKECKGAFKWMRANIASQLLLNRKKMRQTVRMHWDTFKQDNYLTVEGDGRCRVGEILACTTSTNAQP